MALAGLISDGTFFIDSGEHLAWRRGVSARRAASSSSSSPAPTSSTRLRSAHRASGLLGGSTSTPPPRSLISLASPTALGGWRDRRRSRRPRRRRHPPRADSATSGFTRNQLPWIRRRLGQLRSSPGSPGGLTSTWPPRSLLLRHQRYACTRGLRRASRRSCSARWLYIDSVTIVRLCVGRVRACLGALGIRARLRATGRIRGMTATEGCGVVAG